MAMFTHVMVGTNNPDAARKFYDETLGKLGIVGQHTPKGAFYGSPETGMFGVGTPADGEAATHANGGTIGFQAPDRAAIDAWHAAGLALGGTDEGAPGRRDMPNQPIYGAYLRDPDGNKICAFTVNVEG